MILESKTQKTTPAVLDSKVQFLYEFAFAQRELEGLGANFVPELGDSINFDLVPPFDENLLVSRLAHFSSVGGKTTEYSGIVSKNRKHSDNQFLTHWYYPYKGKYHPRLVRSILNIINVRAGMTILDPFVGSGTTTLEAYLLGINSIGIDISPVCVLISKVKINAGRVAGMLSRYRDQAIKSMEKDYASPSKNSSDTKLFGDVSERNYEGFLASLESQNVRDFYQLAQLIFASDRGRRRRDFEAFLKNLDVMIAGAGVTSSSCPSSWVRKL